MQHDFLEQLTERYRFELWCHCSAVESGKIEQRPKQAGQRLQRAVYPFDDLALPVVQAGILQAVCEQVDRMQRLPQVMARLCEKARFCEIGFVRLTPRLLYASQQRRRIMWNHDRGEQQHHHHIWRILTLRNAEAHYQNGTDSKTSCDPQIGFPETQAIPQRDPQDYGM